MTAPGSLLNRGQELPGPGRTARVVSLALCC